MSVPADLARIAALPCWRGPPHAEPLSGGMTNRNYLVRDRAGRHVVRLGADVPHHMILRWHELAVARAAHAAGLSPERTVRVTIDGAEHVVTIPIGPAVARIERADGKPVLSVPVLYFAAHAILGQREGVELAPIAASAAPAPEQAR